jgi:hypothetical protein
VEWRFSDEVSHKQDVICLVPQYVLCCCHDVLLEPGHADYGSRSAPMICEVKGMEIL